MRFPAAEHRAAALRLSTLADALAPRARFLDPQGYSKGGELAAVRRFALATHVALVPVLTRPPRTASPAILQMKLKEIKNGRLAMLACAGFAVQAATTGTSSPIENLFTHMAAPWSTTVLSNQPDLCAPTPLRPRGCAAFCGLARPRLTDSCPPTAAQVRVALGRPDLPVQPGTHQGPAAGGLSARRVTTARARAGATAGARAACKISPCVPRQQPATAPRQRAVRAVARCGLGSGVALGASATC